MTFTRLQEVLFRELSQEVKHLQTMDAENFYVPESSYRAETFYVMRLKNLIRESGNDKIYQKWLAVHGLL